MTDIRTLTVTDHDRGAIAKTFTADAAGYEAAFENFATDKDRRDLADALDQGCVFESWSGKSTEVIERADDPLRFWAILCGRIETDNQVWEVE